MMDPRDSHICSPQEAAALPDVDQGYLKPMKYHPTPEQRRSMKVGRNDACPCGSGKKFKKCCLWMSEAAKRTRS